jgi:hypothetical protein
VSHYTRARAEARGDALAAPCPNDALDPAAALDGTVLVVDRPAPATARHPSSWARKRGGAPRARPFDLTGDKLGALGQRGGMGPEYAPFAQRNDRRGSPFASHAFAASWKAITAAATSRGSNGRLDIRSGRGRTARMPASSTTRQSIVRGPSPHSSTTSYSSDWVRPPERRRGLIVTQNRLSDRGGSASRRRQAA